MPSNEFKTLVISNVAETYYKTYRKLQPHEAHDRLQYDMMEAERGAFYSGDNKAVVTSYPIDKEFMQDLRHILGYKNFENFHPHQPSEKICSDIIKDKALFSHIEKIVKENPGINIIPYYATEDFFDLLEFFKSKDLKFTTPETVSAKNRFIRDHYNCKVGFRKLWEKATDENSFVKIPQGFIVDDLAEAVDAAWWFYQNKKDFVMKYNRGTSGLGVIFYHCKDLPNDEIKFKKYLRSRHQDRIWFEENFVVEELIDVDKDFYGGSPSVEFKVNGIVKHQYNCFQRLGVNSYFEGIMVSEKLDQDLDIDLERVVENCEEFGDALQDLGYKGNFDVDLVVDKKHNVYAVESNLRRTGGTHIYETACNLLGKNFEKNYVVFSRDNFPVSDKVNTYDKFKKRAGSLFFDHKKKQGIIPTITTFLSIGHVGFMAVSQDVNGLKEIEDQLAELVE